MNITFTAETPSELKGKLIAFLEAFDASFTYKDPRQMSFPSEQLGHSAKSGATPSLEAEEAPASPAPSKRGRKPKAQNTAAQSTASETAVIETEEETVEPKIEFTRDLMVEKLKQVNAAMGIATARELLTQFGASRVSDIDPSEFVAFYHACEAAIK